MTSFMERKRAELQQRGTSPERLPPGQYATDRFPVLHIGPVPTYSDTRPWSLHIGGTGVARARTVSLDELHALPSTEITVDIHCVTKWSKFDMRWRGVLLDDLLAPSEPLASASSLLAHGEYGYSSSLSYGELRAQTCLIAYEVDGEPLAAEHGAPVRLVVPHLYFWKSVKWLRAIELWPEDGLTGFWEQNGYHEHGDPFREQRYWGDDE